MVKNYIRFIDSDYNTLFYVPDGGTIRVTSGYDASVWEYNCKYIDETHAQIGNNVYHLCQFAELMERNGNKYEATQEIGDLGFYQTRFFDRGNLTLLGNPEPYYCLVERNEFLEDDNGRNVEAKVGYAYCLKPSSPEKTFCVSAVSRHGLEPLSKNGKRFALRIEDLSEDHELCSRINKIVHAIKKANVLETPSLEDQVKVAAAQKAPVSETKPREEQTR